LFDFYFEKELVEFALAKFCNVLFGLTEADDPSSICFA
jgi:hypothetical protein